MTSPNKPADSLGPIQTLSMDEFKALVDGTKKTTLAELSPALLDFLRQYEAGIDGKKGGNPADQI